jgi:hypothetical protein
VSGRQRYLGDRTPQGGRTRYLGDRASAGPRQRYTGQPTQPTEEHHHTQGVGGFLSNLGSDVVSTAEGFVPGVLSVGKAIGTDTADVVKHPGSAHPFHGGTSGESRSTEIAKGIGHQYAQTYGPLVHGDVNKFLNGLYAHPIGPILDVSTVLTGGAGALGKAGILSDEARVMRLTAPNGETTIERLTSHNPAIRARQELAHKVLMKLPYEAPHFGEAARYARTVRKASQVKQLQLLRSPELKAYNKSVRGLNNVQLVVTHLIGNDLHPLDYADTLRTMQEHGGRVEPTMFKVLENPQVVHEFEHPSLKTLHAVNASKALSELSAKVLHEHEQLNEETAAARIGKHRIAAQEILGRDLRSTPSKPFYVPDVPLAKRVRNAGGARMGGGASTPKNIVHQNHGVLFKTGQLVLNHDILGPKFLESVKHAHADDIHQTLMESAARLSTEEAHAGLMPKGWEFVPKDVIAKTGRKRAQQIHPLIRNKAEALRQVEEQFPSAEQIANSFKHTDLKDAATLHGHYLIVPSSLKRELVGEFTRSTSGARKFLGSPMKVWRALVLGGRVGFLTNNVITNHLLYALHTMGTAGLRSYLNAVKRVHGPGMVRSLLQMKGLPEPLRQQFMHEFFPEQIEGTFGRTQRVGRFAALDRTKIGRAAQTLSTGVAPATQALSEGVVRRALVESYIRRSPQFKKVYTAMPRQTRDFETAARQVLSGERGAAYQRRISEQVNNALGDYLNLTEFEQRYLRSIFPFYSWYRAIVRITAHLAIDTPGRTNIVEKLGQIGNEDTQGKLGPTPDYMLADFAVGKRHGDTQGVISTGAWNPFQTPVQLGQGAVGLLTGKPGETGKAFSELGPNPAITAAIQSLSGKDLFTGRTIKNAGLPGLPGQILSQIAAQLPQTRLEQGVSGHGATSKLSGKQTPTQALLQYLGIPYKRRNVPVANRNATRR